MKIVFHGTKLRLYSGRELSITGSIALSTDRIALIRGANAAGKTLLLNSIASVLGLEEYGPIDSLDRETVEVQGLPADPLTFAWVRQNPRDNFVGRCSADEIILPLLHPRFSAQDIESRMEDLLLKAGITQRDLLERPIAKLSGGEQQKAAVCAAVAPGPSLLLLDEVFARLDYQGQQAVALLIKELCTDSYIAVAAHEAHRAARLFANHSVRAYAITREGDHIHCEESEPPFSEEPVLDPRSHLTALGESHLADVTDLDQAVNDPGEIIPRDWVRVIPATGPERLRGRRVQVTAGRLVIAHPQSFTIREGLTILIGQNGSGKSTLGELLTGGIPINPLFPRAFSRSGRGELVTPVDNQELPHKLRKRGQAAFLPAEPHRWLVEETVEAEVSASGRRTQDSEVRRVLDHFGINPDAATGELSYGQQKAISILSLPRELEFICLDEPFAGLSRESSVVVRKFVMNNIRANEWKCVLLTTADVAALTTAFGTKL